VATAANHHISTKTGHSERDNLADVQKPCDVLKMIMSLVLMLATPQEIMVGGWDTRPTATVAQGFGAQLTPIKAAAEKCGFSRTWVWDDGSAEAQLWVLASEVRANHVACLRTWKTKNQRLGVKWMLTGLRSAKH
jgi:hypothetical protein